jgi:hypothetical protein
MVGVRGPTDAGFLWHEIDRGYLRVGDLDAGRADWDLFRIQVLMIRVAVPATGWAMITGTWRRRSERQPHAQVRPYPVGWCFSRAR